MCAFFSKNDIISVLERHPKMKWFIGSTLARYRPYGLYAALRKGLQGCTTVVDIGCGSYSLLRYFTPGRFFVGIGRHEPSLKNNGNLYSGLILADVLTFPIVKKSVDAAVSLDVIEHLERADGERMIEAMETLARKSIIIYTPNGFLPQKASADNPWQLHRSGWTVEDFRQRGFEVYGINGAKGLRTEYAVLNGRPRFLWEIISRLSHQRSFRNPERAFALCAIKRIDPSA